MYYLNWIISNIGVGTTKWPEGKKTTFGGSKTISLQSAAQSGSESPGLCLTGFWAAFSQDNYCKDNFLNRESTSVSSHHVSRRHSNLCECDTSSCRNKAVKLFSKTRRGASLTTGTNAMNELGACSWPDATNTQTVCDCNVCAKGSFGRSALYPARTERSQQPPRL